MSREFVTGFISWVFLRAKKGQVIGAADLAKKRGFLRQANVPQDRIRHISDKDPLDLDDTLPLILGPNGAAPGIIDLCV